MTAGSERQIRRNGTPGARIPFRVKDPRNVASWSDKIAGVRVEHDFTSYLADRSRLPARGRSTFAVMRLIKGMYEVVVTFAGSATRAAAAQGSDARSI